MIRKRVTVIAAVLVFWTIVVSFVEFNFPSILPANREDVLNYLSGFAVVAMPILGAIIAYLWVARVERSMNPQTVSHLWLLFLELRWIVYMGGISFILDLFVLSRYGYVITEGMPISTGLVALGANFAAVLMAYIIIQAVYEKDSEDK